MASKDHKMSMNTVRKQEKEFKIFLDCNIAGSLVIWMTCVVCKSWEHNIKNGNSVSPV